MKLKSLHLHGFKSFADRTTLDFRDGVTAVIGSNGCGKSNIADAIRWVLGEQRASAVRGSKMEEVIFQGSTRRRPLNFAEVALQFDNEQGRVPIPQSEIVVARKVFREGGSEYSLNRNACRLRDVHNLLRDTGLGSNAYAVIEAGMIETLLSDRAEERRMLFEEAAGIGRYKDSRQATLRRLESAETDLARLNDLLAEVESKVRTLARQRRRAERYGELRARRLELEIWIAGAELASLQDQLAGASALRTELEQRETTAAARRSAAELRIEQARAELATLAQRRSAVSTRLEQLRRELDSRERELLVAGERRTHAEMRIAQLARERQETVDQRTRLLGEVDRLGEQVAGRDADLAALRARLEARGEANRAGRAALGEERRRSDAAAARVRDLAREVATAEGERASAERRSHDLATRLEELGHQQRELSSELSRVGEQAELWEGRAEELRARIDAAADQAELAREEIRVRRGREARARDALRAAEDAVSLLVGQVEAREALERAYEGFAPAVAALMAARDRFPGVRGPLADFAADRAEGAEAVERFLGPLLQAVVVDDLAAARAVRDWFRDEWRGGGSLWLLPAELAGDASGAGWVDRLLGELAVVAGDPLAAHRPGVTVLGVGGEMVDARGVVRLSAGEEGPGILARRSELARLRGERDRADLARDAAVVEREEARRALEDAEAMAHDAEETLRSIRSQLGRVEADAAAHSHQRGRLEQDRVRVGETLASLTESAHGTATRLAELEARLGALAGELEQAGVDEAGARVRLAALEEAWESDRDEEAELRVAVARAESDLRETTRRLDSVRHGIDAAGDRLIAVDAEGVELRAALEGLSGVRERAGEEIDLLFADRDREAAALASLDARIAEVDGELTQLTERARVDRRTESESAEERHRLDLSLSDLRSRAERVVERLEVEWGRPWEALVAEGTEAPEEGTEGWRAELAEVARQLETLGPVNMLALEEHAEEERRFTFLSEQRADLVAARDDLVAAVRQINRTAREMFTSTFEAVRENFHRVFQSLFQGGECEIWLSDPEDPLESLVEIQASPKGKRTQRIHLLSGGERTLTALALLFALYLVKPSPFCVLDEVDAPLDESNVGRFIQLLQDFKAETQFVVITHNPRTMEAADWVYGVTMEEPGISSIVGVELLGAWQMENRVA